MAYTDDEVEQQLKDKEAQAGTTYSDSDLQDVRHRDNSQDALDMAFRKIDNRATNTPNQDEHDNSTNVATQWTQGGGGGDVASQMRDQMMARDQADQTRRDSLFSTLSTRAGQSLNIDPNDPIIKGQTDAYAAAQERNRRNTVSDQAERMGPDANMATTERMASEKAGQATSAFQADLMGKELTSRRDEIAQALESQRQFLTADQQASLQQQIALLDNQIKSRGLDQDWKKALMQNDQFNSELGLNAEDRASYWDAVRSGLI